MELRKECLNCLLPPIKRIPKEQNNFPQDFISPSKVQVFHQVFASRSSVIETSSTQSSLLLCNSSEPQLSSKVSQNFNGIGKDFAEENKPVIKVTVIPKHDRQRPNKQRLKSKTIKNTSSDHEYSIHANNLYFIVTGNNSKEKIYNVKTTESADFSSEYSKKHHDIEEISIKELSNITSLLKSLDMEKNKKKVKKNVKDHKPLMNVTIHPNYKQCNCVTKECSNITDDLNKVASRVRIFGRLGLNNNDEFVMNCAATVNDTLIPTNYPTNESISSPVHYTDSTRPQSPIVLNKIACINPECSKNCDLWSQDSHAYGRDFRNTKEVNVQVNTIPSIVQVSRPTNLRRKESQGTQVDFFRNSAFEKAQSVNHNDKTVQCNCLNCKNTLGPNESKETQNPLVVISVYPKEETTDLVKITQHSGEKSRTSSPLTNYMRSNKKELRGTRRNLSENIYSAKASRSPSPNRNSKLQKNKEDGTIQSGACSSKCQNGLKIQKSYRPLNIVDKKEPIKRSKNLSDSINTGQYGNKVKNITGINHIPTVRDQTTTKTEIKRALIDGYTKNIIENMDKHKMNPTNRLSNVKINIDNNNEFYDVTLQQDKRTTDLKIRKKIKDDPAKNGLTDVSVKEPKRKSRDFCCRTQTDTGRRSEKPNINIRDSLEISHRRETNQGLKNMQIKNSKTKNDDLVNRAHIKHFVGDSCKLPDPLERDKQIRELLGLNWIHQSVGTTSKITKMQSNSFGNLIEDIHLSKKISTKHRDKNSQTEETEIIHEIEKNILKTAEFATQCDREINFNRTIYQELVLHRNIEVFLQFDRFTKQKPIVLSRRQYVTIKRTLQKSMSKRANLDKRKNCICKRSLVSVGDVKKKIRQIKLSNNGCDKITQTETQTQIPLSSNNRRLLTNNSNGRIENCCDETEQLQTIVLFNSKDLQNMMPEESSVPTRQAVSSVEVNYSVSCKQNVSFSSTKINSLHSSNFIVKKDSIQTLFRGWRKSPTPNLGTSAYSLDSEAIEPLTTSVRNLMEPFKIEKEENRRPFFKRLMSCLVMRSKISQIKIPTNPSPLPMETSMDSYHISTSLGAMEMTSSMYDTSISFYSDHNVFETSSKTKRSFFNSVRGFLTNRKS
ncbi:uncharacterized protein LOC114246763 [Bombyx mandarina]|uniref:Uncharacterized protein LOC114246763 n=1 Tax=Bombyx mandarina TaxID=7092 RepID=A0A6J2K2L9_BOMMA|nr:uncharacterized protein LOC114246763 [Bombyx mandarina]